MTNTQRLLTDITASVLFGKAKPNTDISDIPALLGEARKQSVYTIAYSFLKDIGSVPEDEYLVRIGKNVNNFEGHGRIHELMESRRIPYVTLKGIASAAYMGEPALRDMGDVDILVAETDFNKAEKAAEDAGFTSDDKNPDHEFHRAYTGKNTDDLEIHWGLSGIPEGETGDKIRNEILNAIETAQTAQIEGVTCRVPDRFHHGLILLIHMASHLTAEGMGLRHLCDWAVFVNTVSDDAAFTELFKSKLRDFGLWNFAETMTAVCVKYLGLNAKGFAGDDIDDNLTDGIMDDIMSAGNFGRKDKNREREIKYINAGDKGIAASAVSSMNRKVYKRHKFIANHKFFLPTGWVIEGGRYAGLLLTGKRKRGGTADMMREAAERKELYGKLRLYLPNKCD